MRVSQTVAGSPGWRLEARSARLEESETRIYFDKPRLTFFDKGEPASEVEAETGFLDMAGRDAELSRNVVVVSRAERMTLKTEKVFYSSAKNRIWSDEAVTVLRGRNEMRGEGFTANPDLSEIEIDRQRTTVNQPSDIAGQKPGRKPGPKK